MSQEQKRHLESITSPSNARSQTEEYDGLPDSISIVVPAFNEERRLPSTLSHISAAITALVQARGVTVDVIVVDNNSTDRTAECALEYGATVVKESVRNIAKVRNTGANHSIGEVIVFLDADVGVPTNLLIAIHDQFGNPKVIGGAVATDYRPKKRVVKLYLDLWAIWARFRSMTQGIAQFCRRDAFQALQGYNESLYMSEDVDFYTRLRRHARDTNRSFVLIEDPKVLASSRRFDEWPVWKTILWTNPLTARLVLRSPRFWRHWYQTPPRS